MNKQDRKLIEKMMEYYAGDPKRVQHFLKVYEFAKLIGESEELEPEKLHILRTAAIVHDIGIKISEEKYGTDNTQFCFGENTFLHYRFLHYIQAETAYIIHAVAKRCRKKSRPLQPLQAPLTGGHRKVGTRFIGRNLVEIYKMFQHCILLLDLSFASSIATIRRMYSEERRYSVATLR